MEVAGNVFRVVNVLLSIAYMVIIVVRMQDRALDRDLALYLRGVGLIMASAVVGSWLLYGQPFRISQALYTIGMLTITYASLRRHVVSGDTTGDSASDRGRGTNA